jgi:short-subunit dehydrogenase
MGNTKPLALITGASSGIGATFARQLARDGYGLILVARRRDRLETLARELGGAETIEADLTIEQDLKAVEDRIDAAPDLELLVNNAGFGAAGRFYEIPVEIQDRMHRLHVLATLRLAHAALRGMTARNKGAVINVASVAGMGQSPGSISYSATKAWMIDFTEGLYLDLRTAHSAVKVQALCPGFTYSEFHDVMGMSRKSIPGWLWLSAEDVVADSLAGLKRGELFVVPGRAYQWIARFERWMPGSLRRSLAIRYARKMKRPSAGAPA